MQLKRLLIVLPLVASLWVKAQNNNDVLQYINTYRALAIQEMQRTGVPASIKLAQGIHETMAGKSDLVQRSNNHFGIKCKATWTGNKVYHDDDARGECFRSYSAANDSYQDHSNFLKNSQRYAFLFALDPTDYRAWAYGLKKAGYATNIKYSQILIKLIDDYNLQDYTLIALGRKEPSQDLLAALDKKAPAISTVAYAEATIDNPGYAPLPAGPSAEVVVTNPSYPQGEFTIHNTRVIYAAAGTSLLAIAKQYDVSLRRLVDFNELENEDILVEAQLVYLQRKRKTGANEFHTVQHGESLYDICQAEAIRYESLIEYNHLKEEELPAIGERLFLQHKAPGKPRLTNDVALTMVKSTTEVRPAYSSISSTTTHVVQTKETLYSIARKYAVSVEQLKEWNKLEGYELKIGQELLIYKN